MSMHPQSRKMNLESRRDEVRGLAENNELRRAGKRLQDLAADFGGKSRQLLNEATAISSQIQQLLGDERLHGPNDETRARHARLVVSILTTADFIADQAAPNLEPRVGSDLGTVPARGATEEEVSAPRTRFEKEFEEHRARRRDPPPATAPVSPQPAFRCAQLSRTHKGSVQFHLRDISLELRPGEITGVVGVNGSGKSTLLRLVAGALLPTAGEQSYPLLQGPIENPQRLPWAHIKKQLSFVQQFPPRWNGILAENLYWQAGLHGLLGQENEDFVDFILVRLGLERYRNSKWDEISGGFKMRFELAMALVKRPKLLILDEPLAPLDIIAQREFLQDLRDLTDSLARSLSVLLSSQHIFELEAVADRVVVLDAGNVLFSGKVGEIGTMRSENIFELEVDLEIETIQQLLEPLQVYCSGTMVTGYLLKTPLEVDASTILNIVQNSQGRVRYLRDVSMSVRTLLKEEAQS